MSDEMDHAPVANYGARGLALWRERVLPHGYTCRCLSCADARAYMGRPAMTPPMVPARREERAS